AAIALNRDEGGNVQVPELEQDCDLDTLFRILMQCQIVDDVLDYRTDALSNLPSFLTSVLSAALAIEWTADTARLYGPPRLRCSVWPLRLSLTALTAASRVAVHGAYWRFALRGPVRTGDVGSTIAGSYPHRSNTPV